MPPKAALFLMTPYKKGVQGGHGPPVKLKSFL